MNKVERKKGSEIKVGKKEMDRLKERKRMKKWMNGKEGCMEGKNEDIDGRMKGKKPKMGKMEGRRK